MFAEAETPHHLPHFHAYYQEHVAIYSIDPLELIGGSLPRRQQRLAVCRENLRGCHSEESAAADDEESRNSLMAQKSRSFAEFTLSGRRAQDDTLGTFFSKPLE